MPPQENRVNVAFAIALEDAEHPASQSDHVLIVFDDRHPLAVLVRGHAIEALQHLEALDGHAI